MSDKTKEILMYILGAMIVIGFFTVIAIKLYFGADVQLEIGSLIGAFSTVVGFFYGSSKSSQEKDKRQ